MVAAFIVVAAIDEVDPLEDAIEREISPIVPADDVPVETDAPFSMISPQ